MFFLQSAPESPDPKTRIHLVEGLTSQVETTTTCHIGVVSNGFKLVSTWVQVLIVFLSNFLGTNVERCGGVLSLIFVAWLSTAGDYRILWNDHRLVKLTAPQLSVNKNTVSGHGKYWRFPLEIVVLGLPCCF